MGTRLEPGLLKTSVEISDKNMHHHVELEMKLAIDERTSPLRRYNELSIDDRREGSLA